MSTNFLTDPTIRAQFIAAVREHEAQDRIVQGTYGSRGERAHEFRGCYFGCAWNSLRIAAPMAITFNPDDRGEIAEAMGLPPFVARVAEGIFEGLPAPEAPAFARAMAEATADAAARGADLSMVYARFIGSVLTDPERGVLQHARTDAQRSAIQAVANMYGRVAHGEAVAQDEWRSARFAAHTAAADAADADAYAADAAAAAAYAAAADAAYADAAAYAADAYAYAAAADAAAARRWQAALLLRLMAEA
jgi:hypothetical protein